MKEVDFYGLKEISRNSFTRDIIYIDDFHNRYSDLLRRQVEKANTEFNTSYKELRKKKLKKKKIVFASLLFFVIILTLRIIAR